MLNIGEELVASYLEYIKGCEFVQKNLYTPDTQGEIDVVAINLKEKKVYICEVAIHLTTGLRYMKATKQNNVEKLTDKFSKDIEYGQKYLRDYEQHYMLWSPVIKKSKDTSINCQARDIEQIGKNIKQKYNIDIEFVINDAFHEALQALRAYARKETKELKCPVLRLLQIEETLGRHLKINTTA